MGQETQFSLYVQKGGLKLHFIFTLCLKLKKEENVFPGTNWCGHGDESRNDDLGYFRKTDKCCREHNKCAVFIPPKEEKYGYFNEMTNVICHCECDKK